LSYRGQDRRGFVKNPFLGLRHFPELFVYRKVYHTLLARCAISPNSPAASICSSWQACVIIGPGPLLSWAWDICMYAPCSEHPLERRAIKAMGHHGSVKYPPDRGRQPYKNLTRRCALTQRFDTSGARVRPVPHPGSGQGHLYPVVRLPQGLNGRGFFQSTEGLRWVTSRRRLRQERRGRSGCSFQGLVLDVHIEGAA
jgi:hypothetical protein